MQAVLAVLCRRRAHRRRKAHRRLSPARLATMLLHAPHWPNYTKPHMAAAGRPTRAGLLQRQAMPPTFAPSTAFRASTVSSKHCACAACGKLPYFQADSLGFVVRCSYLASLQLNGTIPASISDLTALTSLYAHAACACSIGGNLTQPASLPLVWSQQHLCQQSAEREHPSERGTLDWAATIVRAPRSGELACNGN